MGVRASEATFEAGTAAVTMDVTMTDGSEAPAESVHYSTTGSFDLEEGRGELTYDFKQFFNAAGSFGTIDDFQVIFEGEEYMAEIPSLERWVRMDEKVFTSQRFADVGELRELGRTDPSTLIALAAAAELERTGDDSLGDVGVDIYTGSLPLEDLPAMPTRRASKGIQQLGEMQGVRRVEIRLWVDDEDTVHQGLFRFEHPMSEGSEDVITREILLHLSDFGTEVQVEEPPNGDVADLKAFL
jgi:hypothetical protein